MKIENLCIHCMQEKNNASEICPFCGFDPKIAGYAFHRENYLKEDEIWTKIRGGDPDGHEMDG